MSDELNRAVERHQRARASGEVPAEYACGTADSNRDAGLIVAAYLDEHPADDAEPVEVEWMAAVIPGFARADSGVCGARGDGWTVIAHRKPSGWAFVVSGDGCDASRICPTRREARVLLRLFGIPLKGTV
jgi:hypothetical protein